jgi:predicted Zn-dependent protease
VSELARRLAVYAPRSFDYSVKVVDEDSPNAFALPGGFIYVSRGLLVLSTATPRTSSPT